MKLQACQNCWFNGLQYGSVGLPFGYCTRHRRVLNLADETTCGLHVRKDLGAARAQEVASHHVRRFEDARIVRLTTMEEVSSDTSSAAKDLDSLRKDSVADAVIEYGFLESKIGSLAELNSIDTARGDVALTSLGRGYVRNCVRNGGKWTSGIHLYWWTRKRVATVPELQIGDLRFSEAIQLSRQEELAKWSVMMLRLTLLDDIIGYARQQDDEVGRESGITDRAAEAMQGFNTRKLSAWIRKELLPALDGRLNRERYYRLANDLRPDTSPSDSWT